MCKIRLNSCLVHIICGIIFTMSNGSNGVKDGFSQNKFKLV